LRVNVRLVAATNRNIVLAIREGHFREDLFHRLNVVQFRIPPLRERGEDVLLLAEHFLRQFNAALNRNVRGLSRAARQKLLLHKWPGNVRELRNVIERALILETTSEIQPANLPDFDLEARLHQTTSEKPGEPMPDEPLDALLADYERRLILGILEQNQYNLGRAADRLKLSRHALRYRMQRLNITVNTESESEPAGASDTSSSPC